MILRHFHLRVYITFTWLPPGISSPLPIRRHIFAMLFAMPIFTRMLLLCTTWRAARSWLRALHTPLRYAVDAADSIFAFCRAYADIFTTLRLPCCDCAIFRDAAYAAEIPPIFAFTPLMRCQIFRCACCHALRARASAAATVWLRFLLPPDCFRCRCHAFRHDFMLMAPPFSAPIRQLPLLLIFYAMLHLYAPPLRRWFHFLSSDARFYFLHAFFSFASCCCWLRAWCYDSFAMMTRIYFHIAADITLPLSLLPRVMLWCS